MAVACSLLQVLKSMPTGDRNAMTNKDMVSTESPNNKDLLIRGFLTIGEETVTRRFPVIDFESGHSKLAVLKENASVIFYRFLQDRKFNLRCKDDDTSQTADVLDSDEKIELLFHRYQQRHSANEDNSGDVTIYLALEIEIVEEPYSSTAQVEKSTELNTENPAKCDCCGEETMTPELGFKCLHCSCIFICSACETSQGKHADHLVVSCMPRCTYNTLN